MTNIIKITEHNGKSVVSARELYSFLSSDNSARFNDWIKRMLEYGFTENLDYSLVKIGERSAHNKIDYALSLDTAKEISMLQRSEKGKQARQYFIECEHYVNMRMAEISAVNYKADNGQQYFINKFLNS